MEVHREDAQNENCFFFCQISSIDLTTARLGTNEDVIKREVLTDRFLGLHRRGGVGEGSDSSLVLRSDTELVCRAFAQALDAVLQVVYLVLRSLLPLKALCRTQTIISFCSQDAKKVSSSHLSLCLKGSTHTVVPDKYGQ